MASRSELEGWDGPTYQDVLDNDKQDIPSILREHVVVDLGSDTYPASRYVDPEFFKKEVEHVFLKTWQYAVREEEIPNAGDTYVFDLVGRSVLVARQDDGAIRAFENICLHRGRKLMTHGGCRKAYRCPYHGFTWGLDGRFKGGAVGWDFPEIDPDDFPLLEVRVATWAGFVFINFDADAAPLEQVIDPLPRHFEVWKMDECYKAAHVAKLVPANWKATAEAFLENHHVAATHPQISPYTGDANSQYDVLSDHVTRAIAQHGHAGLVYDGPQLDGPDMIRKVLSNGSKAGSAARDMDIPPDATPRRFMADIARANVKAATGRDVSGEPDAAFVDGHSYDLFPNFHLWGGLAAKISYRIRPIGLDPENSLLEVFLFKLKPVDRPVPPPAQMRMLSEDEPWSIAHELEYLAGVYDQDQGNMGPTQEGLRALGDRPIHFGRYSEVRCRNIHRMVDLYIERGEAKKAKATEVK